MASVLAPLLLGAAVGAIASGAAARAATLLDHAAAGAAPSFADVFVWPWLVPFPIAMGVLALAMFAFLAATYLAAAAPEPALREDFRARALASAVAVFVAAFAGLAIAHVETPQVSGRLTTAPALVLQGATAIAAIAAITAIGALWTRHWRLARLAAAAQVSLIVWGWVIVQYPFIVPPVQSLDAVASPPATLRLLLWGLVGGGAILLPSLAYLLHTFTRVPPQRGSGNAG